jgi:hypothetical protein
MDFVLAYGSISNPGTRSGFLVISWLQYYVPYTWYVSGLRTRGLSPTPTDSFSLLGKVTGQWTRSRPLVLL